MRNIVLALLLANFAVWALFNWVIDEPPFREAYDGPSITLISEVAPRLDSAGVAPSAAFEAAAPTEAVASDRLSAEADAAALAAASLPTEVPELTERAADSSFGRCIAIGPFPQVAEAESAMATLVEAGFEPTRTIREAEVWEGYWVYVGAIDNLDSARSIRDELVNNGLDDAYILPNADSGILISLGVFSETTRAMALTARVRQIGYEATIADSMATRETHWLEVMLSSEESVALEVLQAPGRISRLEQLACTNATNG